jgi:hypothetical protein
VSFEETRDIVLQYYTERRVIDESEHLLGQESLFELAQVTVFELQISACLIFYGVVIERDDVVLLFLVNFQKGLFFKLTD